VLANVLFHRAIVRLVGAAVGRAIDGGRVLAAETVVVLVREAETAVDVVTTTNREESKIAQFVVCYVFFFVKKK
jgi:hypothetical protein